MTRFEIGKTYVTRFVVTGDKDLKFTVLSRNNKCMMVRDHSNGVDYSVRIKTNHPTKQGVEWALLRSDWSCAPSIYAA